MKTIFEFDNETENFDNSELERYKQANNMAFCLNDLSNQVRQWYKYDDRESIPTDEIHEKFYDILQENCINLDKLM